MGDTVILRDHPVDLDSNIGRELVVSCARYAEGLETEDDIKRKFRFDDETWELLGRSDALIEAIKIEKTCRERNGASAREKAQKLWVGAPDVLGGILHGDVSPRAKIESARELRAIAATGPESAAAGTKFEIFIDLSGDGKPHVEHYSKSIEINASDGDGPNNLIPKGKPDADTAPQGLLAAIAAKKNGGNDGQPL